MPNTNALDTHWLSTLFSRRKPILGPSSETYLTYAFARPHPRHAHIPVVSSAARLRSHKSYSSASIANLTFLSNPVFHRSIHHNSANCNTQLARQSIQFLRRQGAQESPCQGRGVPPSFRLFFCK